MHADSGYGPGGNPPRGLISGIFHDTLLGLWVVALLVGAVAIVIGIGSTVVFGLHFLFDLNTRDAIAISGGVLFFLFMCWLTGAALKEPY